MTLSLDLVLLVHVMTRISGMFVTSPIVQLKQLPIMWKALMVMVLSLIMWPTITPPTEPISESPVALPISLACELAIGCMLGGIASLSLSIALSAGTVFDTMMGFGNATLLDPAGHEPHPLMASFFQTIMTLLFLAKDGHQAIIMLVSHSFRWFPPAQPPQPWTFMPLIQSVSGLFFPLLLALILPVLLALLSVEILIAFLSKLMPQVNFMVAGASLKLGLGWMMIIISLPATLHRLDGMFWTCWQKIVN